MKKHVLITGASGAIGSAIAKTLASQGCHLYLHYYQNIQAIEQLLQEISKYEGEYIPIQANLTEEEGCHKLAENIFSLDAVVHTGGQSHYGLLIDTDLAVMEQLFNLHVKAPFILMKRLLPKLTAKESGRVVVISSIWGQTGASCEVAYSAVKGAQIAFVKALAKEIARSGVTVNAIAPGAIKSSMLEVFDQEELTSIEEDIPVGRLGLPEDVADAVTFLVSDKSSYITGQTIAINGGWYM